MAGTKIVDLPALGRNLASTDLFELSLAGGTGSRKITGQEILNSTGITIGTTAITSGTVGRVLFEGTGNVVSESANLFWDNVNGRLGIGTSSPLAKFVTIGANAINPVNANGGNHTVQIIDTSAVAIGVGGGIGLGGVFDAIGTQTIFAQINGIKENATNSNFSSALTLSNRISGGNITERMRIASTGNVLINTTTDAGFKLDVNGTARINTLTIGLGSGSVATNTAIGFQGLNANTTGTANTALGYTALLVNTTGAANTAIGFNSLNSTNGTNNSGLGNSSLRHLSSGSLNTALGAEAGRYISDGVTNLTNCDNSVFLGMSARPLANSQTNQIVIGHNAIGAGSNSVVLGNDLITKSLLKGNVLINTTTDVASSKLTIESTTQGFLPPRMTTTQKNAIATPATGLQIYDSTLNRPCFYDGTTWITL